MAKWYYYNDNGERTGPFRGRELKQLALQGTITPETLIENDEGTSLLAGLAEYLRFSKTVYEKTPSPQPVLFAEPNPFTAPMPVEPNPFTLPMPVEPNPFTVPVSKVNKTTPKRVIDWTSVEENQEPSIWHQALNSLVVLKNKAVSLYNSKPDVFVAIVGVVSISIVGGIILLWEFIAWLFRSLSSLW